MKRTLWILLSIVLLIATVPWGFTTTSSSLWLGLPDWAFYSLLMSVGFAACVALALGVAWPEAPPSNSHRAVAPDSAEEDTSGT